MTKGLREGVGGAPGWEEDEEVRPWKAAKADGVREVASAGGGWPVILASRVRSQRRRVKMPSMDPRVFRRLENCSATETIAGFEEEGKLWFPCSHSARGMKCKRPNRARRVNLPKKLE